ncbi:RDD family protein, partial [Tsukamurella strandjordii]
MTDQATGGQRADGAPIALRVLAYVADLCLASTVVAIALIINVLAGVEKGPYFLGGGVIVAIIISIVLHGAFGASPGKMLAGLTVVDADTRRALGYPASAIRSVVFNVLAPLVYLPAWSILADGGRRGIHEKASKTTVVDGADVVAEEPRPQPATPSGPLGGLVAGDAAEDSALQRIPTPLPADAAPTDALTDDADGEPRERLQPPSLPPLPDDVPGLRPVPPRFGPPLADGEESTAAPAAAFAQPPQAPVAPPVPPRP